MAATFLQLLILILRNPEKLKFSLVLYSHEKIVDPTRAYVSQVHVGWIPSELLVSHGSFYSKIFGAPEHIYFRARLNCMYLYCL